MIYRCRWCERGYCEDCLDWDKTDLLGENLKEYELLGFPSVTQAFYVKCPSCYDQHLEDDEARDFCARTTVEIDEQFASFQQEQALLTAVADIPKKSVAPPTPAESMTYATSLDSSGINTPASDGAEKPSSKSSRKRKAAPQTFGFDGVEVEASSAANSPQSDSTSIPVKAISGKRSKRIST